MKLHLSDGEYQKAAEEFAAQYRAELGEPEPELELVMELEQ